VFCTEWDMADLTRGLGTEFKTMNLCLKRFPVHMTAQTGVQAVLELREEHGFTGADVDRVTVAGTERMATINNIPHPTDIMMAQYSIPFCVALALFRDPRDPASFDDGALSDTAIRELCQRVSVVVADPPATVAGASIVTVLLKNGRSVTKEVAEFNGTPARPLDRAELKDKFMTLTRVRYGTEAAGIFDRLQGLENETELGWIGA
jgi:2-methylcitrate dehydratase PrpD